ncbi:hypothetical protein CSQ87_05205 [Bifidobacterium simiarum]|uniref:Uncharacterized protein n=1 Tax=Bifidobacterium simiarum TaxID=2045441 RepID=A0A2M9HF16_9BIFI|nr:hypothetical protein CSQ87_05205 [Bifidobacterium simiarum]
MGFPLEGKLAAVGGLMRYVTTPFLGHGGFDHPQSASGSQLPLDEQSGGLFVAVRPYGRTSHKMSGAVHSFDFGRDGIGSVGSHCSIMPPLAGAVGVSRLGVVEQGAFKPCQV